MKKVYYCMHHSYDYFDYNGNRKQNEIVRLGNNPVEAIAAWRKLKSHDYNYGDSFDRTMEIHWFWEEEKKPFICKKTEKGHNFYTKPEDRLRKVKVIGWDGTVCDVVVTTTNELLANEKELNENGWWYNKKEDRIQTMMYEFNSFAFENKDVEDDFYTMFNVDDEDILI